MIISQDREERRNQKDILRAKYPNYDPKRHDAFVIKYNQEEDKKALSGYEKERGIIGSAAFQNGRARAEAAIRQRAGNAAPFIGISFKEKGGKETVRRFSSESEARKFTDELDRQGVDWMAQHGSGWK